MKEYLIVHKSIVPDYFMKVIEINHSMKNNLYKNISEACKAVNISRSTYYKYKDYVFLMEEKNESRKAVISLKLLHKPGVLSKVLNILNESNTSILTISQAIPIDNYASVLLSIDIKNLIGDIESLIKNLKKLPTINDVKLIAIE